MTKHTLKWWQWETLLVTMGGYALYYVIRKNLSIAMPLLGVATTQQATPRAPGVAGGQRTYNGAVDIGAGEFDWRGVFGGRLNVGGRASVERVSENVCTNEVAGIELGGGDSVEVVYTAREATSRACTFSIAVVGEGAVAARLGDAVLLPDADGLYSYESAVGENRLYISFEGEGRAVVSAFKGPFVGSRFIVR